MLPFDIMCINLKCVLSNTYNYVMLLFISLANTQLFALCDCSGNSSGDCGNTPNSGKVDVKCSLISCPTLNSFPGIIKVNDDFHKVKTILYHSVEPFKVNQPLTACVHYACVHYHDPKNS